MPTPTRHDWLTTGDVANMFGVTRSTVRRWIDDGTLPARRVGTRHWRINRADTVNLAGASDQVAS